MPSLNVPVTANCCVPPIVVVELIGVIAVDTSVNSAIGDITPKDMLDGHQQDIQAERDRKLEAAGNSGRIAACGPRGRLRSSRCIESAPTHRARADALPHRASDTTRRLIIIKSKERDDSQQVAPTFTASSTHAVRCRQVRLSPLGGLPQIGNWTSLLSAPPALFSESTSNTVVRRRTVLRQS